MPASAEKPTKDLVRELRDALGLTQDKVADASGLSRVYVNKIENGHNQAKTVHVRSGLARAFQIPRDVLDAYLDRQISLEHALAQRKRTMTGGDQPLFKSHPRWQELVREARQLRRLPPEAFERLADLPFVWGPLERLDATLLADLARDVQDWAERAADRPDDGPTSPPTSSPRSR